MNITAGKFWSAEHASLTERRKALAEEANGLHERLTEISKETALLDDLIRRLGAHLPAEVETRAG